MLSASTQEPFSCVGRKTLERILRKSGRKDIPREHSDKEFLFGNTSVKSLDIIELMLETPEHIPDIRVLMDVVPVSIPALLRLYVLNSRLLLPDNVTYQLCNRIIICMNHLQLIDEWSLQMIRAGDH